VIIRNAQMLNTVNAFIEKRISLKGSEWLNPEPKPRIRGITMRSSYKDILDFKVFDCTAKEEKITQFKMLMKDPEVQPFFRNYIENIIATSDLRISKRLDRIEAEIEKRKTGGKL